MKIRTTLFAAAATLAMAPAANAYEGLYGAMGAGLSYLGDDLDIEATSGPLLFDADMDHNKGFGVYTALGYAYGNGIRTEVEFSYRNNKARHWVGDNLSFSAFPGGTLDGKTKTYSFMTNLLYDLSPGQMVNPYIGGGVGYARVKHNLSGVNPLALNGLTPLVVDDVNWKFAYQGIAGVALEVAENMMLDISYRYFATRTPTLEGTIAGQDFTYDTEYRSHTVFAGLRWNFGASDRPAQVQYKDCWDGSSVPVTAECPPQLVERQSAIAEPVNFVVYFDFDKSNLTSEAQALIREAAQRALSDDIQTVRVEGHTDRSGSSAYNQALSERRARIVRDALVANGVPADRIQTGAYGEDRPARPTEDGVREPLNRRTEVTIRFE